MRENLGANLRAYARVNYLFTPILDKIWPNLKQKGKLSNLLVFCCGGYVIAEKNIRKEGCGEKRVEQHRLQPLVTERSLQN